MLRVRAAAGELTLLQVFLDLFAERSPLRAAIEFALQHQLDGLVVNARRSRVRAVLRHVDASLDHHLQRFGGCLVCLNNLAGCVDGFDQVRAAPSSLFEGKGLGKPPARI